MREVYLREPANEPARRAAAARLRRRAVPPALPDTVALARDRLHCAAHSDELSSRFTAALGEAGITVTRAADAGAAAARIAALADGTPVAVTGSAVVGELRAALAERAVEVVPTYGPGVRPFDPRLERFWQLPRREPQTSWQTQRFGETGAQRRDVVGLLGVNAVSASTGAFFLVQHSNNIGELLRSARRLVFVVALDKIVADDRAARRQVEAVTAFGADTVLLDLARSRTLGDPLGRFPAVDTEFDAEIILLDNGRTDLLAGDYRSLFSCIGCRTCALRCPTYPVFRGPRGWNPKDYLWAHLRGENPSLDLCTFCGNCEVDCPVDIPLPTLIATRRAEAIRADGRRAAGWRRRVHGEVERLSRVFSATAPAGNHVRQVPLAGAVMERVFGLAPQYTLPAFHRETFEKVHAGDDRPAAGIKSTGRDEKAGRARPRVVYYFGCFANFNNPEVGRATAGILETLGCEVVLPDWRCCGIPLYAKGEVAAARRMAEANIAALSAHVDAGREVVTSCPSCQLALARDYPRLFPSPAADRLARHTHFLSRFLLSLPDWQGRMGSVEQRGAYHLPCHLRALGMEADSLEVLAGIPGLSVENIGRGCCGLSGTFGLEKVHYRTSMDVGAGLAAALTGRRWDVVLTDCGACKMQIGHLSGRGAMHPAEVIYRALCNGNGRARHSGGRPESAAAQVVGEAAA